MAAKDHIPSVFGSHTTQDTSSQRHDHVPKFSQHFVEQERIFQSAETEVLVRENERLASSHGLLRQELVATGQEIQRIQNHKLDIENDYQLGLLLAQISIMEADIQAGENLKKELQEAKMEEKYLVISKEELNAEIQKLTSDLQKAYDNLKHFPQMHAELESLQQEHQILEASYKYNNDLKVQQYEHNHGIDRNLVTTASEAEKLRQEIAKLEEKVKVEHKAIASHPYEAAYGGSGAVYSHGGRGGLLPGYISRYIGPQDPVNPVQVNGFRSESTGGTVWGGGLPQQP